MARQKKTNPKIVAFVNSGAYTPNQKESLKRFYLPLLQIDPPENTDDIKKPIHLLGVAGGVGVSTLFSICDNPTKILDFSEYNNARQFVTYLPRIILVTNKTYCSVIKLQAILQQITDKAYTEALGFAPTILGVAVVDTTKTKKTNAVNELLDYTLSNVKTRWDFEFVPQLLDMLNPKEAAIPNSFYEKVNDMARLAI